jgi:parvulin-like peptidyl-prolyl isomerase
MEGKKISTGTGETGRLERRRRAARGSKAEQVRKRAIGKWTIIAAAGALVAGVAGGAQIVRRSHLTTEPVVRVNGETIDKEMLRRRLYTSLNRGQVMKVMIEDVLAEQYARKLGVYPTEVQVERALQEETSKPGIREKLASSGQSMADFRREVLVNLIRIGSVVKGVQVTEQEARRFYAVNIDPRNSKALYYGPEYADLAVVICAAEAKAKRAFGALQAGARFTDIARQYSEDRSWERGGVLERFYRGRSLAKQVPGLETAVFALAAGQTAGPQKIGGVWWIIRCLGKGQPQTRPYEEVKAGCSLQARLAKMSQSDIRKVEVDFEEYKRTARLQAFQPEYRPIVQGFNGR